ncbi:MAG: lactonase family protein [Lachnospiraceae bacterium]|nr:lactonase family protein [Lachnospiraceae bacterium]
MSEEKKSYFVYIGSWEHDRSGKELGIHSFQFSEMRAELMDSVSPDVCVGAMYMDRRRNVLYCVDEAESCPGMKDGSGGRVLAYQVDQNTGSLKKISEVPAYGTRTSFVTTDAAGQYLLVTNHGGKRTVIRSERSENGEYDIRLEYDETNIVLFALDENGAIGKALDIYRHSGCGTEKPDLQAHPHCVRQSPLGNLFCVCDKGADALYFYRIDHDKNTLVPCGKSPYQMPAKCAPRYCVFHPEEKFLYMNYEGQNRISVFHYELDGSIQEIQTIDVLREDMEFSFKGGKRVVQSSDICIHPNGELLYNITRGLNRIDSYRINREKGTLTHEQTLDLPVKQGGMDTIRGFALSSDAKYLLVGALTEDRVLVLDVDENGRIGVSDRCEGWDLYHPAALVCY